MRKDNVQFSIAVHVMTILAYMQGQEIVSGKLASSVNTSPSFVRRILSKLSKADLVKATAGKKGCCVLNKKPGAITLFDIYKALGSPSVFAVHGYPELKQCPVSCQIKPVMANIVGKLQGSLETALKKITLKDLVQSIKSK